MLQPAVVIHFSGTSIRQLLVREINHVPCLCKPKAVLRLVRPEGATFGSALVGLAAATVETVGKDREEATGSFAYLSQENPLPRLCLKFFQSVLTPYQSPCLDSHTSTKTDPQTQHPAVPLCLAAS